jgi:predicted membrane protein
MIDQPDHPEHQAKQPPRPADPWRSFRLVLVATLILEAIVVLLALPVVGAVGGGLTAGSLGFLLGAVGVLLALVGLQGRSWAIWVNLAAQALLIAGFVVYPGVGFIGVLFAAVWALIAYFAAEVRSRQHEALADRQPPPD